MKGNNQAYKLWLCLLCSFLLLPLEIQAQEKGDSITGKVHKIDEVTVTAERTKQQIKSSSPFQQLNKKQLQQQGITDIADALRRFSGVNMVSQPVSSFCLWKAIVPTRHTFPFEA